MEYPVKQQINLKFTYFLMRLTKTPVFQCLKLNLLLRAEENSSVLNQSGATSFCF